MKWYRGAEHFGLEELKADESDERLAAPRVERGAGRRLRADWSWRRSAAEYEMLYRMLAIEPGL